MSEQFSDQQKEVLQLLKVLNDNNILKHVIVAGSWAEYIYAQAGVLPGFNLNLRTIDMDFLVKNMRRPSEPVDLLAIVKKNNYSIAHDVLLGTTKMVSPGGLEIEFLIGQMGSGERSVLPTNLGVAAQALRHMEGIVSNAITVDLLGMDVQVPKPESYVLHKMLINSERKPNKQIKDRQSIARLLPYINFETMNELYAKFTKKEKARVRDFLGKHLDEVSKELRLDKRIGLMQFVSGIAPELNKEQRQQNKGEQLL